MASSRTINAPGVELREIDRSRYGIQDNSLPNAPIVLITGFADKGENYFPQWINEKQAFFQKFGYPSTEEEKYFFNACMEVLDRGGICIACRLPYDNNESKGGGRFSYCDYQVIENSTTGSYAEIAKLDSNITSFLEISSIDTDSRTMSLDELDNMRVGIKSRLHNKIRIVDVSKSRYDVADFPCVQTSGVWTNDALGIFPVIVTPMNAIYFQGLFNNLSSSDTDLIVASNYNEISSLSIKSDAELGVQPNLSSLPDNQVVSCAYVGLAKGLSDFAYAQETLSKIAADQFPIISFKDSEHLDYTYLKQIGVVVFKAFTDPANNNKVNFQLLESFVGSLDSKAKSAVDNSSVFIDNIVNANSRYINLFSNVDQSMIDRNKTFHMSNQDAKMLGLYEADCKKDIFVRGYSNAGHNDITDSLTKILDVCKDPNQIPIDIVLDAGVSNIAQFWHDYSQVPKTKTATFPIGVIDKSNSDSELWTVPRSREEIKRKTSKWQQVIKKFDDFCHYTRKDCMFIADGLRPFCLEGNLQKVRKTKIGSSVERDVIPYINSIAGINSSYSAGYCNWFYVADKYSGDYFWCPPSIKAASIYVYCDTYFHSWDAPAGMTRGIVPGAIDVAFNPNKDEAGKIYQQSWNYAVSYPMDGIIMEGQKSFQYDKTALDRINVRRLLLKLEKQVTRAAKYFLYEQNTEYQRQKFVDTIRPFFEAAVNGSGLSEYAIKCDNELNTPEVIDNNEMHCKIAVKPIKTIEYIVISLIATSQSASVTEEVMR